jgi:16S rRNA (uracil1498-N3)-methyltransferase
MSVFFLPARLITPPTATIVGELLTHLRDSLRVQIGEELLLSDGTERRYRAEVTVVTKQAITATIRETLLPPPATTPSLVLGQALLKGEKMDWIIQKTTELGVGTIVPLQCRHSLVQPKPDRIASQIARWQRIALEAAQQSEQWHIPPVTPPQGAEQFTREVSATSLRLILMERRETGTTFSAIKLPSSPRENITVLVGPEGGWAREEVAEAEKAGFVPITLGPTILRAETAALMAVGLLQHRLGRLG